MSTNRHNDLPTPNRPFAEDVLYQEILSALMQRLVRLLGAPTAHTLTRTIPRLVLDQDGNVLDYDRDDPYATARLLVDQFETTFGEAGISLIQQATRDFTGAAEIAFLEATGMRPPAPIRILLVDDHVLVREGLVGLIDTQPDLQVVGQAGSIREAVLLARRLRPDLVLMDFTLPDGSGDEATRAILTMLPDTKIVFLTVHDDDQRIVAALSAGATGYLLKSIRSADLLSRLRGVVHGDVALSPAIGRRILEQFARLPTRTPPPQTSIEELTERESEILRLIVQGLTNRQVADALNLSVRTVEYHRANLTSKLGLTTRADLVRYAAEHGLLTSKEVKLSASPSLERRARR